MGKTLVFFLSVLFIVVLSGCDGTSSPDVPFDTMRDNKTQKSFKLGDSKSLFDETFGEPEHMSSSEDGLYSYLHNALYVKYDENGNAVMISCTFHLVPVEYLTPELSKRFSFFDFDFNMRLNDIKNKYDESNIHELPEHILYTRLLDISGNECKRPEAYLQATLSVKNGDWTNIKDGEYSGYSISLVDITQ